jgi:hypothetical protein
MKYPNNEHGVFVNANFIFGIDITMNAPTATSTGSASN